MSHDYTVISFDSTHTYSYTGTSSNTMASSVVDGSLMNDKKIPVSTKQNAGSARSSFSGKLLIHIATNVPSILLSCVITFTRKNVQELN